MGYELKQWLVTLFFTNIAPWYEKSPAVSSVSACPVKKAIRFSGVDFGGEVREHFHPLTSWTLNVLWEVGGNRSSSNSY
jgi:hypothetical protein